MIKKNLRPQQVAPVKRETTAKSKAEGGVGACGISFPPILPFAGDEAE